MRRFLGYITLVFTLAFVAIVLVSGVSYAGTSPSKAKVLEIKGEATYMKAGTDTWTTLEPTTILVENDIIKTGPESEVRLELMGTVKTAEILIGKGSKLKLDTFGHDDVTKVENTLLTVDVGSVLVKAEKLIGDSKFEVKTPTSIVGIRGTEFEVNVPRA